MNLRLIRHATLLLKVKGKTLLVDPMLAAKGEISAVPDVPNKNSNPLVDLTVAKDEIANCDAVLITHHHRDHLDDAAMDVIAKDKLIFCQPTDVKKITKFGFTNVVPVNRSLKWGDIAIARTQAKHGHGATAVLMAPVSGFVIIAAGEPTTYITGDTVWYSKVKNILEKYKPDIAICYCGEATFSSGKPITMDAKDVNEMCKFSPNTKIVAVHMEAWNHCRLTRDTLKKFANENKIQDQVYIPDDGEELTF